MKYKTQKLELNLTLRGTPNKSKESQLLFHFEGVIKLSSFKKLMERLEELYPANNIKIKRTSREN